jgi:hypothetical protein
MTGPVDSLLNEFLTGGWAFIEQLPKRKWSEALHIDFKQKQDARTGELGGNDKEHLAIALSGFANAAGGLLVWGVDANRDDDDIDQVRAIMPISQLRRFRSELETMTPAMVSAPVPGVQHVVIPKEKDSDVGIAITVVPQSDVVPHMARGKNLHRYYRRVSSRFQKMEHYEIGDLFGRRPQPALHVRPFWQLNCAENGAYTLVVQFMVENKGRGIARFPCLTIGEPPKDWPLLSGTDEFHVGGPFRKVNAPFGWYLRYRGGADDVLHPGDRFNVAYMAFDFPTDKMRDTLRLEYELVAEGCPSIHGTFEEASIHIGFLADSLKPGQQIKSDDHPDNDRPTTRPTS